MPASPGTVSRAWASASRVPSSSVAGDLSPRRICRAGITSRSETTSGDRFGWRVFVDNDANIMALGERWSGLGRTADNFLWIKLGTGIGCGIFCNGRIYRGTDGCAGDIGHVAVGHEQILCTCGNTGCLGQLAGGEALARQIEEAARAGKSRYLATLLAQQGTLEATDLSVALAHRDPYAAQVVRRAGASIGDVLAGFVNFYNPSLIVVGGGLSNLGDLLLAAIREAVYRRSAPLATRHLSIQRSALGGPAGVIGASALVLGELFKLAPVASRATSCWPVVSDWMRRAPVAHGEEVAAQAHHSR